MKPGFWIVILIVMVSCKEKYVANVHVPAAGYLVVEGFINISGTTDIAVTRSSGLDTPRRIPEPGAQIEIQSQIGGSYPLAEQPGGHYTMDNPGLDNTQKYRLHIKTANGREYLSDFTSVVVTPPIDSVSWTGSSSGVTIFVSTHNDQVQPGYYQWQFVETWKYHAAYFSSLEYKDDSVIIRPDSDLVYNCWRTDLSTEIAIANTEKLSANVIYQYPLTLISYTTTDKLILEYSILVKQYAISKDWYEWIQKVKRNTEQVGSIFDAQPSETSGNVHCITDSAETVIGYIGSTTETSNRIFISRLQIPPVIVFSGYEACEADTIGLSKEEIMQHFHNGLNAPISFTYTQGLLTGIRIAGPECIDCRLKGGTTVQPPFWQ